MTKGEGRYIYGIARPPLAAEFGDIGVEDAGKAGRVVTLTLEDVCVVSSEFSSREKLRPVRKNLDAHHKVIREVMKTTTLLPATFGQVARSEADIAEALRRHHDAIHAELDHLGDKVEMTLRVVWDVDNVFEHLVHASPALAALRDQTFGRSVAPSHAEMLELGETFEELRATLRAEHTERVLAAFADTIVQVKENPVRQEKMVMNLAFLVAREKQQSFEAKVYQVSGMFPAEYTFDFNGPWAPFNFVELDLELDTARAA